MARDNNNSLSEADIDKLIERQSIEWPLLKNNFETLRNSRRETMESENTPWKVSKRLLNYRKGSLTANLDAIAKGKDLASCAGMHVRSNRNIYCGEIMKYLSIHIPPANPTSR